jgi:hypothetical protein
MIIPFHVEPRVLGGIRERVSQPDCQIDCAVTVIFDSRNLKAVKAVFFEKFERVQMKPAASHRSQRDSFMIRIEINFVLSPEAV